MTSWRRSKSTRSPRASAAARVASTPRSSPLASRRPRSFAVPQSRPPLAPLRSRRRLLQWAASRRQAKNPAASPSHPRNPMASSPRFGRKPLNPAWPRCSGSIPFCARDRDGNGESTEDYDGCKGIRKMFFVIFRRENASGISYRSIEICAQNRLGIPRRFSKKDSAPASAARCQPASASAPWTSSPARAVRTFAERGRGHGRAGEAPADDGASHGFAPAARRHLSAALISVPGNSRPRFGHAPKVEPRRRRQSLVMVPVVRSLTTAGSLGRASEFCWLSASLRPALCRVSLAAGPCPL